MFRLHNRSLFTVLTSVYPEYEWLPWKFSKVPVNYWNSVENRKKYMDWAGEQLGVKELSDWYNVNYKVKNSCYFCLLEIEFFGGLWEQFVGKSYNCALRFVNCCISRI